MRAHARMSGRHGCGKAVHALGHTVLASAVLCFAGQAAAQSSNPMWSSGYRWLCQPISATVCERDSRCRTRRDDAVSGLEIDYERSRVTAGGEAVRMRRHYAQTVDGSPLQAEVKIELVDNRVIWLTPVDISRVFSDAWVGLLVDPKGGAVLSVSTHLLCRPAQKKEPGKERPSPSGKR